MNTLNLRGSPDLVNVEREINQAEMLHGLDSFNLKSKGN